MPVRGLGIDEMGVLTAAEIRAIKMRLLGLKRDPRVVVSWKTA